MNFGFGSYQINKNILKRTNCDLWNVFILSKEYTSFYSNLQGIWKEFCPSSSNSHVFLLHLIVAWIVWPTNRSWNRRNTKTQRRNEVRVFFNGLIVSGEELCMLIVLCVKRRVARTNRHCLTLIGFMGIHFRLKQRLDFKGHRLIAIIWLRESSKETFDKAGHRHCDIYSIWTVCSWFIVYT